MEAARSACAEIHERFIGNDACRKKWPGLDRHRAMAADASGDRNALGRINRRSRRFARSSITERRVCHERFRIARVRRRVSARWGGRVLFGARYSWSGRTDWGGKSSPSIDPLASYRYHSKYGVTRIHVLAR